MSFPEAPPEVDVPDVGFVGLRFTAEFEGGRSQKIDLSSHPLQGFAKEAARVLWAESRPLRSYRSPGVLESANTVLRAFGEFAVGAGYHDRIDAISAITVTDVSEYETWLRAKYGQGSMVPYMRMSTFRQFLLRAQSHGLVSSSLSKRLTYVTDGPVNFKGKEKRDGYSAHVTRQLLDGAWSDVDTAVVRITVDGPALIDVGADPVTTDKWSDANIVWAAYHQGLTYLPASRLAADGSHHVHYRRQRDKTGDRTHDELIALVYPILDDAFAFSVLISLGTGLPIECVRELKIDCLRNESRGYADLFYVKRRRGSIVETKKRVKADSPRSPGGLIKLILTLTKTARQFASADDAQWLIIGYGGAANGTSGLRRLIPGSVSSTRFCARHHILDDKSQPIDSIAQSRLRKTFKAEQYKKANGHIADSADDHSKSVHATRYADIPSLAHLHEATVAEGLEQALASAMAPVFLTESDERRLTTDPEGVSTDLGINKDGVEAVLSGAGDVWFATCLGYDKSPYAPSENEACPCPVWGCLACKNAVITSSKLPAIIAFLNHILQRRQEMDIKAWSARFGVAYQHITHGILPRFPEREVLLAKAVASDEKDLVWLPAELTMTR